MAAGAGICEDTPAGRVGGWVGGGCGDGARGWVPTCRWRAITAAVGAGGVAADGLSRTGRCGGARRWQVARHNRAVTIRPQRIRDPFGPQPRAPALLISTLVTC